MRKLIIGAALAFSLSGCGIPIAVLYALEGVAATATVAKDVVGIDVSLKQDQPGIKIAVPAPTPTATTTPTASALSTEQGFSNFCEANPHEATCP